MLGGKAGGGRLDKRAGETVGERRRKGDRWNVVKMEETETGKLGRARERAVGNLSARETEGAGDRVTREEGDRVSRRRGTAAIKRQETRKEGCS